MFNILEVDILKKFENDKDETCFCNDIDPNGFNSLSLSFSFSETYIEV